MRITELKSKDDAIEKGLEIHPLYDYPVRCNRCNSNISANKDKRGLFQCDCRFYIFNYPCGVHFISD